MNPMILQLSKVYIWEDHDRDVPGQICLLMEKLTEELLKHLGNPVYIIFLKNAQFKKHFER